MHTVGQFISNSDELPTLNKVTLFTLLLLAVNCRFVNSVVFYGITLNAKNLGGSFHLNVFILFAVGIPGVFALWVIFKK